MTKYRAIRKDNGEWVHGVPITSVNDVTYMIVKATEDAINTHNTVDFIFTEIIPESLSLFTTLHDKNGKEIFGSIPVNGVMSRGGDVLKFNYDNFVQIEKPIEWSGNGFWVKGENDSNFLPAMSGTEIIGNQYESEVGG